METVPIFPQGLLVFSTSLCTAILFFFLQSFLFNLIDSPSYRRWEKQIRPKAFVTCCLLLFLLPPLSARTAEVWKLTCPSCASVVALGIKVGNWWYLFFPNLSLPVPKGCFNCLWIFLFCLFQKSISVLLGPQQVISSAFLWFFSLLLLLFQRKLSCPYCWRQCCSCTGNRKNAKERKL